MSSVCRSPRRRAFTTALAMFFVVLAGAVMTAPTAQAHPLGNFTVSHYNNLTLTPDGIEVLTVVDSAEIPTQQEQPAIDVDDDGQMSSAELSDHAQLRCSQLETALNAEVNGVPVEWEAGSTAMETVPGSAGLPTLRMTCRFSANAPLDKPASLNFSDQYRPDRIGWREITAKGEGVRLLDPPVPSRSISDELRNYPQDLLSSPLDVRSVNLATEPGESGNTDTSESAGVPGFTGGDPLSRLVTAGDRQLNALIGDRELTPLIGGLAVLLAMLLGVGHAALPGHGKTVMAAYLAGRRGRPRDAVIVGATVTATHTVGVLVLGLLLTISSAFVGEQALRVLGVISGALIVVIGIGLLRDALRARHGQGDPEEVLAHAHQHDHTHAHSHHGATQHHSHGPGVQHGHHHGAGTGRRGLIGMGVAGGLVPSPSALVVLMGSIALGRTVFGVLLVLAYGFGMAATLTAVGLLLVRLRGRLDRYSSEGRAAGVASRVISALPTFTASLVLVLGLGLVARGLLFGP